MYPYQWNEPISNFRGVGWYFSFSSYFARKFCKQTVKIMNRYRIMRCLFMIFTVCLSAFNLENFKGAHPHLVSDENKTLPYISAFT